MREYRDTRIVSMATRKILSKSCTLNGDFFVPTQDRIPHHIYWVIYADYNLNIRTPLIITMRYYC